MSKREDAGPASFEIDGESDRVTFAVEAVNWDMENRIAERERVYRDGARLDGTGTKADRFSIVAKVFNGIREKGVARNGYPGDRDKLIKLLKRSVTQTGTLKLPTWPPIRCKALRCTTTENVQKTDFAHLNIIWVEDNEETQLEATFTEPNARSAAVALADQIVEGMAFLGAWDEGVAELKALAVELESLALFANERGDDLIQAARSINTTVADVQTSFLPTRTELQVDSFVIGDSPQSLLSDPSASATLEALMALSEMASKAIASVPGKARPRSIEYKTAMNVFDISLQVGASVEEIVELNPSLIDPFAIPANTTILLPGIA